MTKPPIFVTRPALPPLDDFLPYLREIWESRWLTNAGPYHQRLEKALETYLGVEHVVLCSNGTMALLLALRVLGLKGEVITTPYSFVATAHAILWAGLEPVFVDIDPYSFNLDPAQVESALSQRTAAIMPVHCYGNPCDVDGIETLARRHQLPVIYDAAHAFGVELQDGSLLQHGDLSVLSFHATKVFNTFEGGAIVCHDENTRKSLEYFRNFGFENELHVPEIGINAKMNEFQAALGLLQLEQFQHCVAQRQAIDQRYREQLDGVQGLNCNPPPQAQTPNYSYFSLRVEAGYPMHRDGLVEKLRQHEIFVRRYFYPLITDFPFYRQARCYPKNLPQAHTAAEAIICLPIYPGLALSDVDRICQLLKEYAHG